MGIGTSVHYKPLHRLSYYKKLKLYNKIIQTLKIFGNQLFHYQFIHLLKRCYLYLQSLKQVINENI